jgi:hypothetical protein
MVLGITFTRLLRRLLSRSLILGLLMFSLSVLVVAAVVEPIPLEQEVRRTPLAVALGLVVCYLLLPFGCLLGRKL